MLSQRVTISVARPRKSEDQKRRKWPVLNVTPAERAAIEAAAQAAGLGINAYLIACTQQTRLVRRADHARTVRHLARIDAHLEQIAREVAASSLPGTGRGKPAAGAAPDRGIRAGLCPRCGGR